MSKTRDYIKEKNIEVLFEELMRYVINKKPENPVKYLISLLQEKGATLVTKKTKTKISSDGPTQSRTCASHDLSCAGQAIDIRKSLERVLPKSFDSKPVLQEQDITQTRSVSAPPVRPTSTIEVRVPSTQSAPHTANQSEKEEVVKEREEREEREEPTEEGDESIVVSQEYVNNVESFFNFGRKKKKPEGSLASGSTGTLKDDASDDEKGDDSKRKIKKKDNKTSDAESEDGEKSGERKKKGKDKKKAKKEKDDEREDVTESEEEAEDGKKKDKKRKKEDKSDEKKMEKEARESKKMDKKKKKDDENSEKEIDKKKKHKKEKKESEGDEKVDVVDKAEPLEYSEQHEPTEFDENREKWKMEDGAAVGEGDEETSREQEVMTTASCDLSELASWRDGEMEIESILDCRADGTGSAIEQSTVRDVQSAAPPSTHIIKQTEDIILKEEVFFAVKSPPGVGGKAGARVTSPCNTVFFDEPTEDLPVVQEPTQLVAVFKVPDNRLPERRERILKYINSGNSDDMSISELTGSPWTYADSIS